MLKFGFKAILHNVYRTVANHLHNGLIWLHYLLTDVCGYTVHIYSYADIFYISNKSSFSYKLCSFMLDYIRLVNLGYVCPFYVLCAKNKIKIC
jgi:hypothetical protein